MKNEKTKRTVAVILTDGKYLENVRKNVDALMTVGFSEKIEVFSAFPLDEFNFERNGCECSNSVFPAEKDTEPKRRNWINSKYANEIGWRGFLWVVAETTSIAKDPSEFAGRLERAMDVFDYSVWFSTVTDGCNYVFSKYNPRMTIHMDRPDVNEKLGFADSFVFVSNSNCGCVVYDMSKNLGNLIEFDEDFTIGMFWIIEFLARRRNSKKNGQPYFMNWYLSLDSERGVFENCSIAASTDDSGKMKAEDAKFKEKKIDYRPEHNVDSILEIFHEKLKAGLGIAE